MGTPIPVPDDPIEDVPAGNECVICWGEDRPFGNGDTPSQIKIEFDGIEKSLGWLPIDGEPPDGVFICNQIVGIPCQYLFSVIGPEIRVAFFSNQTQVRAESDTSRPAFFGQIIEICQTVFSNQGEIAFENGTATVTIPGAT